MDPWHPVNTGFRLQHLGKILGAIPTYPTTLSIGGRAVDQVVTYPNEYRPCIQALRVTDSGHPRPPPQSNIYPHQIHMGRPSHSGPSAVSLGGGGPSAVTPHLVQLLFLQRIMLKQAGEGFGWLLRQQNPGFAV